MNEKPIDCFGFITSLQYRLKASEARVKAFESGERYIRLAEEHRKAENRLERENDALRREAERSEKQAASLMKTISSRDETIADLQRQLDALRDREKELLRINSGLEAQLEEEKGKNLKLRAQLNRDYENSSLPSSGKIRNKKISNSREKSGKKPGGQPGHEGHRRKRLVPGSDPILVPPPREVLENPGLFIRTSDTVTKQVINIRVEVEVTEYVAEVYYNPRTGKKVHGRFPKGVKDDVNYGGSVKAFVFLLNNDCFTSIDKARKFLYDLTGGKLDISKGMVNNLSREFSLKTEEERRKIFADMLCSPVMHTDNTNARVNGRSAYVFVCATPDGKVLYSFRDKKGHKGIKETAAEDYRGILVHDHDKTFYSYGDGHQECLAHVLRYLKDSMDNEPERQWNSQMRLLIQEMIHYRNSLPPGTPCDEEKISEFEERYRQVLSKAKEEYRSVPPSVYYKDGYNLYLRMEEYMDNHLLFLRDPKVPPTNNEAERLLRNYKRKQRQAVSFRSADSVACLCDSMSMLVMLRSNGENNLFEKVSEIYG